MAFDKKKCISIYSKYVVSFETFCVFRITGLADGLCILPGIPNGRKSFVICVQKLGRGKYTVVFGMRSFY